MRWENALVSLKKRQGWNEQSSLLLSEVSEKSSDESLVRLVIRVTFLFLNSFHTLEETSMKHMPSIGLPGHWQQLELGSKRVESFPCSSLQNPHKAETSRSNISDAMAYSSIHRDWQLHHFVGISHICNHLCVYVTYCIIFIYTQK